MANVGFTTSFSDLTGGLTDIFGTEGFKAVTEEEDRDLTKDITGVKKEDIDKTLGTTGRREEYLDIDPLGVERIIQQVLGGTQGLASVFSGEQTAGLYNTTVAAQASGDLLAQLAGEIAKLTAKKVSEVDEEKTETGAVTTDISETQKETGSIDRYIETISNQEGLIDPVVDAVVGAVENAAEAGPDITQAIEDAARAIDIPTSELITTEEDIVPTGEPEIPAPISVAPSGDINRSGPIPFSDTPTTSTPVISNTGPTSSVATGQTVPTTSGGFAQSGTYDTTIGGIVDFGEVLIDDVTSFFRNDAEPLDIPEHFTLATDGMPVIDITGQIARNMEAGTVYDPSTALDFGIPTMNFTFTPEQLSAFTLSPEQAAAIRRQYQSAYQSI